MARRPSTVSLSSVGSGTGLHKLSQLPPIPGPSSRSVSSRSHPNGSPLLSRSVSTHTQPDYGKGNEHWDPDELFTKHTVNEVKLIQQRLRYVSWRMSLRSCLTACCLGLTPTRRKRSLGLWLGAYPCDRPDNTLNYGVKAQGTLSGPSASLNIHHIHSTLV